MATIEHCETGQCEQMCLDLSPLQHTMRERGISDLQLAKKVGVKVDVIRRMYRHVDDVSISLIEKICNALDCGLDGVMVAKKVTIISAQEEEPNELNC